MHRAHVVAVVVLAFLAACGGDPPAQPAPDAAAPCGGACGPGTVCEAGRCVPLPAPDAGVDAPALDGPLVVEAGVDVSAPADAPAELPGIDAEPDATNTDAAALDAAPPDVPADVSAELAAEASADTPVADVSDAAPDTGVACGATVCAPRPGTVAFCAAGECVYACRLGFADCNAREVDGCEVDLRSNAMNCSACGRACRPANGTGACADSACTLAACNTGFADCDGNLANGCEVEVRTSVVNCGACGRACADPGRPFVRAVCEAGTCGAQCMQYRGDCDGNATNGCEVYLCQDPMNCGRCGQACTRIPHLASEQGCADCGGSEMCTVYGSMVCEPGWDYCPSSRIACDTDLMNDPRNCGACNRSCGTRRCVRGACDG